MTREKIIQRAEIIFRKKIAPVIERDGTQTPESMAAVVGVLVAHIAKAELETEALEARVAALEEFVLEDKE
ncbi:hypothetical protein [Alcanivorax quisquiliarum]|uniref:Cell division protein ZapA n=1 Tax=Alcanivorax quisquiliarum TaxID=2933565 RepID=A0ABT0E5P3_9GAMM|nr:hypothetical protein [Alcanivorax quisquiliarum]MCK0537136.1 hypothetical protein [Alcanivorax quisquiliarum]